MNEDKFFWIFHDYRLEMELDFKKQNGLNIAIYFWTWSNPNAEE